MSNWKSVALAATVFVALAVPGARAADLPPPPYIPRPPVEEYGGWYLRGYLGMTNQTVRKLDNVLFATTPGLEILQKDFDSSPLFGLGVGMKFNSWMRFDLTGEYRGKSTFHGLDRYLFDDGGVIVSRVDDYRATKSEWLFLANAYFDLGTWYSITPYVGAGIGFSHVKIGNFRDMDPTSGTTFGPSVAFAADTGKWNFAWAVHAGLSYAVTPNFNVELAYRFVSLGHGQSGDIIAFDGSNPNVNPMHFRGLYSHDLMLGVRWMLEEPYTRQPPLIRKG